MHRLGDEMTNWLFNLYTVPYHIALYHTEYYMLVLLLMNTVPRYGIYAISSLPMLLLLLLFVVG